ncbi:MAG: hypothetical protein JRI46_09665 [Deltaproteobacteria bacterium]|nr:hypothetical protein [Deltaproteobacteria bacterium]
MAVVCSLIIISFPFAVEGIRKSRKRTALSNQLTEEPRDGFLANDLTEVKGMLAYFTKKLNSDR